MAAVESITSSNVVNVDTAAKVAKSDKKQANKDLQKTRMCVYFLDGKCGYGTSCTFAHSSVEVKSVPDLTKTQLCAKFAEGKCMDKHCTYAHGEAELRDPPNFKKKFCKWHSKGKCRNGSDCGFAHDSKEIRAEAPPGFEPLRAKATRSTTKAKKSEKIAAPPGLTAMCAESDGDASTDVPSSSSLAESDLSVSGGISAIPEEHLFRLMAGRGSAPLQQQVSLMSSAIGGLQAKLSQLEDMMLQTQVNQMQQTIQQLTEQCWALEEGACVSQPMEPVSLKSRLSAKAAPFTPAGSDFRSDDSTSASSESAC